MLACKAAGRCASLASLHESGMPQALSRACAAMVLAVELPGFGCDTGPALTGEARDRRCCEYVHAALRYLRRKGATNISVVGRSLGVGVVLKTFAMYPRLANNTPAVVLVSGFTSVKDMCSSAWLKPFVSERFCNRQNITMLAPRMRVDNAVTIWRGTCGQAVNNQRFQELSAAALLC